MFTLTMLLLTAQVGVDAGPARSACNGQFLTLRAEAVNPPDAFEIQWENADTPGIFNVVTPTETTTYRVFLTDLSNDQVYEDTVRVLVHPGNSDLNGDEILSLEDRDLLLLSWSLAESGDLDPDGDKRVTILDSFYFCDHINDPPNTPPSLMVSEATTTSGLTVAIPYQLNDAEQDAFLQIDSQPSGGFVTLISGNLRYTPDEEFFGTDTFTITATDGFIRLPPLTVTVQVLEPDSFNSLFADLFLPYCAACHVDGNDGGLRLGTYAELLAGGKSGPGVVRFEIDRSPVYTRQVLGQMPPVGQIPTPPELIERLRLWILLGANE